MRGILAILLLGLGAAMALALVLFAPQVLAPVLGQNWSVIAHPTEQEPSEQTNPKRERGLKLMAEASVQRHLIDPFSAVFQDLKLVKTSDAGQIVCGLVNAKNRMGAYVGRTQFLYEPATDFTYLASDGTTPLHEATRKVIASKCGER